MEIDAEVESLSHEQCCEMVLVGMSVAVQKTNAEVPQGWEEVALGYLEATLKKHEAEKLVRWFTNGPKERVESAIHKFLATEAAVVAALPEIVKGLERTGCANTAPSTWREDVQKLAKLGALSVAKLEGIAKWAGGGVDGTGDDGQIADAAALTALLEQFAAIVEHRAKEKAAAHEQGNAKGATDAGESVTQITLPSEFIRLLDNDDLEGLKVRAMIFKKLMAKHIESEIIKANSKNAAGGGDGNNKNEKESVAQELSTLSALSDREILLEFLEQPVTADPRAAQPRLAFRVVGNGSVKVLAWMLDAGVNATLPNYNGETLLHYAAAYASNNGGHAGAVRDGDRRRGSAGETKENGDDARGDLNRLGEGPGVRMVEMLLSYGALVDVQTKDGVTPLHLAALGDFSAVKVLVAHATASAAAADEEATPSLPPNPPLPPAPPATASEIGAEVPRSLEPLWSRSKMAFLVRRTKGGQTPYEIARQGNRTSDRYAVAAFLKDTITQAIAAGNLPAEEAIREDEQGDDDDDDEFPDLAGESETPGDATGDEDTAMPLSSRMKAEAVRAATAAASASAARAEAAAERVAAATSTSSMAEGSTAVNENPPSVGGTKKEAPKKSKGKKGKKGKKGRG